jgi:hypothetical protein
MVGEKDVREVLAQEPLPVQSNRRLRLEFQSEAKQNHGG